MSKILSGQAMMGYMAQMQALALEGGTSSLIMEGK